MIKFWTKKKKNYFLFSFLISWRWLSIALSLGFHLKWRNHTFDLPSANCYWIPHLTVDEWMNKKIKAKIDISTTKYNRGPHTSHNHQNCFLYNWTGNKEKNNGWKNFLFFGAMVFVLLLLLLLMMMTYTDVKYIYIYIFTSCVLIHWPIKTYTKYNIGILFPLT